MPRKLAAGNWKMNGLPSDLSALDAIAATARETETDTLICLPATLIAQGARQGLNIGAQSCHPAASGAHTGDLSAEMLVAAGATHILAGHSERRADHGETDADVATQAQAIWRAGAMAVICIGETLEQRETEQTLPVIATQLAGSIPKGATPDNTAIAYEPVWAIGTGKVASPAQVAEVHDFIRAELPEALREASLLYGGSVKASNAAELFALENVNGGLVGGASLKAADFCPIIEALAAS